NLGGVFHKNLGALDVDPTPGSPTFSNPTAWTPEMDAPVDTLVVDGSSVFVGGEFKCAGPIVNFVCSVPRLRIAKILSSGAAAPFAKDANAAVYQLALPPDRILYAVGAFTVVDGSARAHGASFDLSDESLTSFDPAANDELRTVAVAGGGVYVGGRFTTIG